VTKAGQIRRLAAEGLSEFVARIGIHYQHAYNVLKGGGRTRERAARWQRR